MQRSAIVFAAAFVLIGTSYAMAQDDGERRANYLAGMCSACHSGSGEEQAIPGLQGRSPGDFRDAMQAFKSGQRKSQIMASVAATLSDQDVDLLARYFAALNKGDAQ